MAAFITGLTNLTAVLPRSRDCSCYVSRPMLAPPPLWLQKHTDQRAHDFAHSRNLRYQPSLAYVTCAWSWILRGINPAVTTNTCCFNPTCCLSFHKLSFNFEWEKSMFIFYFLIQWPSSSAQHTVCDPFLLIRPVILRISHHSNLLLIPWDHTRCLEVSFVLRLHSLVASVLPLWKMVTNCSSELNISYNSSCDISFFFLQLLIHMVFSLIFL
jgi:hypothetical protein